MKKITLGFAILFFLATFSFAHAPQGPDLAAALKEALDLGAKAAISNLSKKDGFLKDAAVKILLPTEAQNAITKLQSTPTGKKIYNTLLSSVTEQLVTSLNRSAEDAVTTALPIFGDAIKNITIMDGLQLLTGGDHAATNFLKEKTNQPLFDAFKPSIDNSLNKSLVFNKSSKQIWTLFTENYNKIANNPMNMLLGLKPIQQTDLTTFVTQKGLDGLFVKISDEEKRIRDKPAARTSDLLKDVFGNIGK